jgi:glycerol-3-phosphate dehydrogenase (NAD(P)+)
MRLGVIGGGAWGTALAQTCTANGPVTLWAREPETVADINERRENRTFLPGIALSPDLEATTDLADLSPCDALLLVTPAQHARAALEALGPCSKPIILCCKGIEAGTKLLMSEVAEAVQPGAPLCVLSGPTFADEVARGLPAAVTFSCADAALADRLIARIASPAFRPYASTDVIGAEVGGAVKNVLAIACGVAAGLDIGKNARAAIISRGFAEMLRFGLAKGAREETLAGLSGLGDLVLTCSSEASRNMSFGKALGEGRSAADLMADRVTVAEGVHTAPVLVSLARDLGVEMPIAEAVLGLVQGNLAARDALTALMQRPLTTERSEAG